MNKLIYLFLITSTIAIPTASFAGQQNDKITEEEYTVLLTGLCNTPDNANEKEITSKMNSVADDSISSSRIEELVEIVIEAKEMPPAQKYQICNS